MARALPKLVAVGLMVNSLAGCAAMRTAARRPENSGTVVAADFDLVEGNAEKLLQEKGYTISTKKTYKGPAGAGVEVTGMKHKDMAITGKKVLGNLALGAVGSDKHVKKSEHEVIWFEINRKWDEATFTVEAPHQTIVRTAGARWNKDMNNQDYDVQKINLPDLSNLEGELISRAGAPH